jgi:hypothetical protein
MTRSFKILFFGLPVLLFPTLTFALSPLVQYNDLVAGESGRGFEDGPFYAAQFDYPLGLSVSQDGSVLYVADRENNRIRSVNLNDKNRVLTLAGTGERSTKNGAFSSATFSHPRAIVCLPDQRIAVSEGNEGGTGDIRLLDLSTQKVTTLAGGGTSKEDGDGLKTVVGDVWNMVFRSLDNCLYFSEPNGGTIKRLNLKNGFLETVLKDNELLPHPEALCISGDKLYAADRDLDKVYEVTGLDTKLAVSAVATPGINPRTVITVVLQEVGKAHKIIALAGNGTSLYAYEGQPASQSPIVRLFPDPDTLTFGSVWGETMANASQVLPHFLGVSLGVPVGFVPDPRSEGRFYVTNPMQNIVVSLRDLRFGTLLSNGSTKEFTYPEKKPYNTYRILLCGRSYLYFQSDKSWDGKGKQNVTTNIMMLVSKKLELLLNTQAALEDVPVHFEVFNEGRVINSMLYTWPYYEVPQIVKKYDIDKVMIMMDSGQCDLAQFFQSPITAEGIPAEGFDPEFDLRSKTDKFKTGPLHSFFELCQKKNFLTVEQGGKWYLSPFEKLITDREVENRTEDLMGRPLGMLKKKLDNLKTSSGKSCQLDLCYFPQGSLTGFPYKSERNFWKEICVKDEVGFLDLTDDFLVTRLTYYPFSDMEGNDHFSKDGHTLFAHLLAYELVKNNMIPFKPANPH